MSRLTASHTSRFLACVLPRYLATLYLQRQASVAYMVHSTLDDVLNPGTTTMQSTDEVYSWLTTTLQVCTVWEGSEEYRTA